MAIIEEEDIRGFHVSELIVCTDCVTEEEDVTAKRTAIIDREEMETSNARYFCDRCDKRL